METVILMYLFQSTLRKYLLWGKYVTEVAAIYPDSHSDDVVLPAAAAAAAAVLSQYRGSE